jgi:hypothetical protein
MDSFHIACKGHIGRLQNILKPLGLDSIEKALLKQRILTLKAGQGGVYGLAGEGITRDIHREKVTDIVACT